MLPQFSKYYQRQESVWALFDVLGVGVGGGVKALKQSFSDGTWEVASAAVDSLLVINDGVPNTAAAFPPKQQQLSQWQPWCCCPPCAVVTQLWLQNICSHIAGYSAPPSQPPTHGHQTGEMLAVFIAAVIQLVSSQTLFCLCFPSNDTIHCTEVVMLHSWWFFVLFFRPWLPVTQVTEQGTSVMLITQTVTDAASLASTISTKTGMSRYTYKTQVYDRHKVMYFNVQLPLLLFYHCYIFTLNNLRSALCMLRLNFCRNKEGCCRSTLRAKMWWPALNLCLTGFSSSGLTAGTHMK